MDVPPFNLGLNSVGSFASGAGIANQIIQNQQKQQELNQNYDISNRQVSLQERAAQIAQQRQQAFQTLAAHYVNDPNSIGPIMAATNPEGFKAVSDAAQQVWADQYKTLDTFNKSDAKVKQSTYDLLKPELQKQFPDLEFGDKVSPELMASLKARQDTIGANIKANLETKDTGTGYAIFNPVTGQTMDTGIKKDVSPIQKSEIARNYADIAKEQAETDKLKKEMENPYFGPQGKMQSELDKQKLENLGKQAQQNLQNRDQINKFVDLAGKVNPVSPVFGSTLGKVIAPLENINQLPQYKDFNNLSTKIAGQAAKQNVGSRVSNYEAKLYQDNAANISNGTKTSNIDFANQVKAVNERGIQENLFNQNYLATHGTLKGADESWDRYTQENPILQDNKSGTTTVNDNNITNWKPYLKPGYSNKNKQSNQSDSGTNSYKGYNYNIK